MTFEYPDEVAYRLAADHQQVRDDLAEAERKLAEIRAIAANNHIGGMSVPMSQRLIAIIDR